MTVVSVENLSKAYRLGQIGTGTLTNDLRVWWAKTRGKPNPMLRIGRKDHGNQSGETIWALKDVGFSVEQGEVLGIIGRNGAGKSTILKILSRITAPTSGQVKVRGRIASLLEVGTGFHPELTGRENTYLNGAILGMTRTEVKRKFDEIVAFSEVEQFIDTPVKRYSSGMYVRLAFAVAAHLDPEILLVDEVLAVGDAEFQKKCLGKMGDIAGHGRTVLFVSHNMGAVRSLCGRVILLQHGGVTMEGDAAAVVAEYIREGVVPGPGADFARLSHTGSGEARIVAAELRNARGEPASHFRMDEGIVVNFGVETAVPTLRLLHAVEVQDSEGMPIYHFLDVDNTPKATHCGRRRTITARLPPLELYPGDYNVTLWIGSKRRRTDRVENCLRFTIRRPEYSDREFTRNRGVIHKLAEWDYSAERGDTEAGIRAERRP
jgi:lipopolysaccharide transport system ATP-binding protein